jgi:hypothetical protein
MSDKSCQRILASLICVFLILSGSCFAQRLTGKWEGTYSESRRVIVFSIEFESETRGTLQILGKQIPVSAKRTEGSVEIRTEDNDPTVFLGKEQGNVIAGELRYRATTLHFWMKREPLLAQPKSRNEAWQQGLDYAQQRLLRLETSFTPASRQEFIASIANLKASVETNEHMNVLGEFLGPSPYLASIAEQHLGRGHPRV